MKISYGKNVYGHEEINAVLSQLNKTTQMGINVHKFEEKISTLFSKNYGVMKSLYTAISQVNDDACSVFDCDLQDPANLLENFISHWKDGYKVIYGKRVKRNEGLHISIFRKIFNWK